MRSALLMACIVSCAVRPACAQIGISADGAAPNTSAMLDIDVSSLATKKGLLVPRMTAAERAAITAPATGAMVYETTTDVFFHYNGSVWVPLFGTTLGWRLPSNAGITGGTHFIGTTDAVPLEFRRAGRRHGWVSSASDNTSWGDLALDVNTGPANSAIGTLALWHNTTGSYNTACGRRALGNNTTGSNNTAVGSSALTLTTNSNANTVVGSGAMSSRPGATACTAIGEAVMSGSGVPAATNCTAMGKDAMMWTSGSDNTACGEQALFYNTTGAENTAVGQLALRENHGNRNTALHGLRTAANMDDATCFGPAFPAGGDGTCAISFAALNALTNGQYNIAFGSYAAQAVTTGDYNVAIGWLSGANQTTGSLGTAVGDGATFSGNGNSQASIGYNAVCPAANTIRIGNSANNSNLTGGFGAWQNISDGRFKRAVREDVPGLAFINGLRPVTYRFDVAVYDDFTGLAKRMRDSADVEEYVAYQKASAHVSAARQTGFLAQEVDSLAQAIGYEFSGLHRPTSPTDHYTIGYEQFVVPLVKAVQEQQVQLTEVRAEMEAMRQRLDRLASKIGRPVQADPR